MGHPKTPIPADLRRAIDRLTAPTVRREFLARAATSTCDTLEQVMLAARVNEQSLVAETLAIAMDNGLGLERIEDEVLCDEHVLILLCALCAAIMNEIAKTHELSKPWT